MKRRDFLKFSSATMAGSVLGSVGLLSWSPRSYAQTIRKTFYITEGLITQPDGVDVYFQGFSNATGSLNVPGETLMAQEGDTLEIMIVNTLGSDHSFVIDGVVDSGRIRGGESKTVSFNANSSGSYLYYDGMNAPYNRLVGLHGSLAIMPAGSSTELYSGSPTFVQQYTWIFNDIDPAWHDLISQGRTPRSAYKPYYFTLNGLSMRVPGSADYADPAIDAGYNKDTSLSGSIGDRALIRVLNAGMCGHAVHWHANHVEWLSQNGSVRPDVWLKDIVSLDNNMGRADVIYPFEAPTDAWPPVTTGKFPMHLHDEMSQTAGGGMYQFGAATTIKFI